MGQALALLVHKPLRKLIDMCATYLLFYTNVDENGVTLVINCISNMVSFIPHK